MFFSPSLDPLQSGAVVLTWTCKRESKSSTPGGGSRIFLSFFFFPFSWLLFPSAYMYLERRSITVIKVMDLLHVEENISSFF